MSSNATTKQSEAFILFELGKTTYAIPGRLVQQMEMIEEITLVPKAPPFVEGVVLSRGQVIPVLNLRTRFGFEKIPHNTRTRLIVVSTGKRTVGLLVDSAREFVYIPLDIIQPPSEQLAGLSGQYLSGIAKLDKRLVLMLDIEEVINISEDVEASQEVSH